MTIREIIENKAKELANVEQLGPHKAAEELVELSSLLASIGKECAERKYWYSLKKVELLKEHGTAAKAEIHGEASKEYQDFNQAEEYRKAVLQIIGAIKYYLRVVSDEQRNAKY